MSNPDYSVRLGVPEDAETIAHFNCALAKETEPFELDLQTVLTGVTTLLTGKAAGTYYVLEKDGQIIAQLLITYEFSDWRNANLWWIQSVYVKPEHRRNGYFKALYNYVREEARKQGSCGLRLYAENDNARAHATYEKLGMSNHYKVYEDIFFGPDHRPETGAPHTGAAPHAAPHGSADGPTSHPLAHEAVSHHSASHEAAGGAVSHP